MRSVHVSSLLLNVGLTCLMSEQIIIGPRTFEGPGFGSIGAYLRILDKKGTIFSMLDLLPTAMTQIGELSTRSRFYPQIYARGLGAVYLFGAVANSLWTHAGTSAT